MTHSIPDDDLQLMLLDAYQRGMNDAREGAFYDGYSAGFKAATETKEGN